MKTKLYIDLDGTILNTNEIKKPLFEYFFKLGFDLKTLSEEYNNLCKEYNYNNNDLIDNLNEIKKLDIEKTKQFANNLIEGSSKFIYKDVKPTLEKLSRENKFELNLISLGNQKFQMQKAESSGIAQYFNNIYYTPIEKYRFLKNIVDENEQFIIVDDRSDALSKIKQNFPNSIVIEINRTKLPTDPIELNIDFVHSVITDFNELLELLRKID